MEFSIFGRRTKRRNFVTNRCRENEKRSVPLSFLKLTLLINNFRYCSVCMEGYGADWLGLCDKCEDSTTSASVLTSVFFCMLAGAVFGYYKIKVKKAIEKQYKKEKNAVKAVARILFISFQVLSILPTVVPDMGLPQMYGDTMGTSMVLFQLDIFEVRERAKRREAER